MLKPPTGSHDAADELDGLAKAGPPAVLLALLGSETGGRGPWAEKDEPGPAPGPAPSGTDDSARFLDLGPRLASGRSNVQRTSLSRQWVQLPAELT